MTINWQVTPTQLQENGTVTFIAAGLRPFEIIRVRIQAPTTDTTIKLQADAEGRIAAPISLVSGKGRYNFIPDEFCGAFDPQAQSVLVCDCLIPSTETPCALEIAVSPQKVVAGQPVSIDIFNATPNSPVQINIIGNNGEAEYIYETADALGRIYFTRAYSLPANYTVAAFQHTCPAVPKVIRCIGDINLNPLASVLPPECGQGVIVTPQFIDAIVQSGGATQLVISICNGNNQPLTVNVPSITLPAGVTCPVPVQVINQVIPAQGCKDFYFDVTVANTGEDSVTRQLNITSTSGSYVCNGVTYAIAGGSTAITINPVAGSCAMDVETAFFTPGAIGNGQTTTLSIAVKNNGTTKLTNVTCPRINMPVGMTPTDFSFSGQEILPGATYTFTQQFTAVNNSVQPITNNVFLPVGHITAICKNQIQSQLVARIASLIVNP